MKSTIGRPRKLTDAQVQEILTWDAEVQKLKSQLRQLGTVNRFAKEFSVSRSLVASIVARRGIYKQVSPDAWEGVMNERRQRLRKLTP